jgi:nucleoside phosphorylase
MTNDKIIVPQGAEYAAVCRGLKQAQSKIEVISIPIGVNSVVATLKDYRSSQQLQRILILGLCGSLSNDLKVADVVIYRGCYNLQHHFVECSPTFSNLITQKLTRSIITVNALTSDRVICQASEKLALSKNYPATVVDMEGFAYLRQLQHQNLEVAIVRVVSDDITGDIPNLANSIDKNGNLLPLAMSIAMLRQPIAASRLIRGSLIGLKVLQQVTRELFKEDL